MDIKRILIELLIVIFGLVIGLINLSYPFGIREIATIILLIGMGILGAIIYISDKNKKNLELIKPIFLSRLNTDIDYDRQGDCTLCIPLIPFTKADNINSCLKKDLEFINEEIESYNNLAKAFVCDFNSEIISLVKLELPTEHDDIVLLSKPLKYHTKHLYYQIGKHLSSFEDGKPQILHFNTRPTLEADGITRWKADIVNVLFVSVDKTQIDKIEEEILRILDTTTHSTRFTDLNRFFERIKGEYNVYKKEMTRVMKNTENGVWLKE